MGNSMISNRIRLLEEKKYFVRIDTSIERNVSVEEQRATNIYFQFPPAVYIVLVCFSDTAIRSR